MTEQDDSRRERDIPLTYEQRRTMMVIDRSFSLANRVVWALFWVAIAYYSVAGMEHLAGKETNASFFVQWLTSPNESGKGGKIWFAIAVACSLWAVGERKLRHRKTGSLSGRIKQLESQLDPKRTGSGLTKEGKTPKSIIRRYTED